jgi:L-methionine (R)-S-oxide reductase
VSRLCAFDSQKSRFFGLAPPPIRHYVPAVATEAWLKSFLSTHGGVAGTVHLLRGDMLTLESSVNIPPPVAKVTATIPKGKGMAGLAWERDEIVATCNLKSDSSGDVRPGAKAVDAQAALAIPVRSSVGNLRAVVGIAFMGERDFSQQELQAFEAAATSLPDVG